MTTLARVLAACAIGYFSSAAFGDEVTSTPASTPRHELRWKQVSYPKLPLPDAPNMGISSAIYNDRDSSGDQSGPTRFMFNLQIFGPENTPLPAALEDPEVVVVRMHFADGKSLDPEKNEYPGWDGWGNAGSESHGRRYYFPWVESGLEDVWIEARLPELTLWLAVPYGLMNKPGSESTPSARRGGLPAFAPAMKDVGAKDRFLPWLNVLYEGGVTLHGWHLEFDFANATEPETKVILYRDDSPEGRNYDLWKKDNPKVSIAIEQAGVAPREGRLAKRYFVTGGMHQVDRFLFADAPSTPGRQWETAVLRVNDQVYRCPIPSSLVKPGHSQAEPGNYHWLPRPARGMWDDEQ